MISVCVVQASFLKVKENKEKASSEHVSCFGDHGLPVAPLLNVPA